MVHVAQCEGYARWTMARIGYVSSTLAVFHQSTILSQKMRVGLAGLFPPKGQHPVYRL